MAIDSDYFEISSILETNIATGCLICGETVTVCVHGICSLKICDKCKAAVMSVREQMEKRRESDETD